MSRLAPGDLAQLATRIPQALHRAALLQAIAEDRTLMAFVAEALTEHLARCRAARPLRAVRDADRNGPHSRGNGAASRTSGDA
jgi:hypothetical protein